jgi:hypothetical protein
MDESQQPTIRYDLRNIKNDIEEVIKTPTNDNIKNTKIFQYKQWLHNGKNYNILKYSKEQLLINENLGLSRSIIFSNGKVNVFSPPKYVNYNKFTSLYNESQCFGEEIVEGTMINLFYDSDVNKWEIATKTSVGGKIRYFSEQKNFDVLFNEVCEKLEVDVNNFDKKYVYSFVMQHPDNRIVIPINQMKLYLISIYEINGVIVNEIPREKYNTLNLDHVFNKLWFPYRFNIDSFENLYNDFTSMNCSFNYIGVMIKSLDGSRSKIIVPAYKYIKDLRGNYNKLQFQYLCLRRDNKVKEYLRYFPESSKKFSEFRNHIHSFTDTLYKNYVSCYIKKEFPLLNFPDNFRTHMFNIHQKYLEVRENGGYINKNTVVEYVNNLDPSLLMYSLNFSLRELGKQLYNDN